MHVVRTRLGNGTGSTSTEGAKRCPDGKNLVGLQSTKTLEFLDERHRLNWVSSIRIDMHEKVEVGVGTKMTRRVGMAGMRVVASFTATVRIAVNVTRWPEGRRKVVVVYIEDWGRFIFKIDDLKIVIEINDMASIGGSNDGHVVDVVDVVCKL